MLDSAVKGIVLNMFFFILLSVNQAQKVEPLL